MPSVVRKAILILRKASIDLLWQSLCCIISTTDSQVFRLNENTLIVVSLPLWKINLCYFIHALIRSSLYLLELLVVPLDTFFNLFFLCHLELFNALDHSLFNNVFKLRDPLTFVLCLRWLIDERHRLPLRNRLCAHLMKIRELAIDIWIARHAVFTDLWVHVSCKWFIISYRDLLQVELLVERLIKLFLRIHFINY